MDRHTEAAVTPKPGTIPPQRFAHLAGEDAANRQMRAAGRTKWSRADYNLACVTSARLLLKIGNECDKAAAREVLGSAA